jgi:hypothetical protein
LNVLFMSFSRIVVLLILDAIPTTILSEFRIGFGHCTLVHSSRNIERGPAPGVVRNCESGIR